MIQLFLALLFSVRLFAAESKHWTDYARDLIGENRWVRATALSELKKSFPSAMHLSKELDGPHRHYALDVWVAYQEPQSVEPLFRRLNVDQDGAITLAVNALLHKDNVQTITEAYQKHLSQPKSLPTAALVGMIDFYSHTRQKMNKELLDQLLGNGRMEVQQAAINHIYQISKHREAPELIAQAKNHFRNLAPQVRAQVLFMFLQLEDKSWLQQSCVQDQDPVVQSACRHLRKNNGVKL